MRLMLLLVLAAASCSKSEERTEPRAASAARPVTDPAAARKLIADGAVVLDVRTPEEFEDAHVPGAVNVPVQDVAQRVAEVERLVGGDKSRPVVVYCGVGGRAAKAKQELEASGFTQVVNGGGYKDLR